MSNSEGKSHYLVIKFIGINWLLWVTISFLQIQIIKLLFCLMLYFEMKSVCHPLPFQCNRTVMAIPLTIHQDLRLNCVGLQAMTSFNSRAPYAFFIVIAFILGPSKISSEKPCLCTRPYNSPMKEGWKSVSGQRKRSLPIVMTWPSGSS